MVKRMLANLGLGLVVVFPVWFIAAGVGILIDRGPAGSEDLPESVLFYFMNAALPLLAAGTLHQLILLGIPQGWPTPRQRVAAVLTSFVIVSAGLVIGGWVGLFLGAPLYGLLLRLPRRDHG